MSQSTEEVVIELAPGVSTTVKRSALASLTLEPAPPGASQPSAQAERETKSDDLPGQNGGTGAQQDGSQAPTPQAQEESEGEEGEEDSLYAEHLESQSQWFKDRNRHRYLYAPSAMMTPRGQGSISQIELFFTSFNYSLTDWMSVQVGGALPLWFVDSGFNLIGGVKFGGQVLKYLHLAAGAQNLVIAPEGRVGTIGIAYGATTFGTPDLNLSLLVGMPWQVAIGEQGSSVDLPVINISGIWRFSEHMAVASENWIFPGSFGASFSAPYLLSLALRAMTENLSTDVGFVVVPLLPFPLPWLSVTWAFGG